MSTVLEKTIHEELRKFLDKVARDYVGTKFNDCIVPVRKDIIEASKRALQIMKDYE